MSNFGEIIHISMKSQKTNSHPLMTVPLMIIVSKFYLAK